MTSENVKTLALAAGLGGVSGLRSMTAPALLSRHLARHPGRGSRATDLLSTGAAPALLTWAAAGEIIADKMPFVPDRTDPLPATGRVVIGAFVGVAVAGRRGGPAVAAGLLGAAAALGTTFLGNRIRRWASRETDLPDMVVAVAEDTLALSTGTAFARLVG